MRIVLYTEGPRFSGDALETRALGGSESAFISVARELARQGHEVVALCRCDRPGGHDGVAYRDIASVADWERTPHDLFLCSRYFAVLARPLAARVKLLWMHDVLSQEWARQLAPLLDRADLVYCLSHYHRDLSLAMLPALASRLAVTANGIDPHLVESALAGVGAKQHRVLFTSRPERGLVRALDVYEALGDRSLALSVCTYPSFPDPRIAAVEAEARARLQSLVERGFEVSVSAFDKRALYRHLAESKLVLYPTDFAETFCLSALEAQACGTAFLTSDDFALRETVGYRGVPRHDTAEFVRRARAILSDETLRRSLEAAGRAHAARYTWEAVARRFVEDATAIGRPAAPLSPLATFDRIGPPPRLPPSLAPRRTQPPPPAPPPAPMPATMPRSRPASAAIGGALPKISCLVATRDRLRLLKRAIASYCAQTYEERELVIVTEAGPRYRQAITDHLTSLARSDIRLVCLDGEHFTLGSVRNASVDAAAGAIVCQWDDDDLSHPDRLSVQAAHLVAARARASYFSDHLQLFWQERVLHWIDWTRAGRARGKWRLAPGTMMMFRDPRFRYPEHGPSATKGEDTALLDMLWATGEVAELRGQGHLYLYSYHGANTYSREHHANLRASAKSVEEMRAARALLQRALKYYPVPRPFALCGREGLAAVESP